MQDLLTEDDFIKQTPYHNPQKSFGVFYLIALAQLAVFMIWVEAVDPESTLIAVIAFAMVMIMPFIMAFYGKNSNARLQALAIGIFILLGVYYFPLIAFAIYGGSDKQEITTALLVFLGNYVFSTGITLLIVRRKQKRINIIQP